MSKQLRTLSGVLFLFYQQDADFSTYAHDISFETYLQQFCPLY
jgi:hypothetical protein